MKTKISRKPGFAATYAELCREFLPRPIHDEEAYRRTERRADALAGHDLNGEQGDYFELLCTLMEEYEAAKIQRLPAEDILDHLVRGNGGTAADLAEILEIDRTHAIKLLNGSRQLTLEHVSRLCRHYGISADAFLPPAPNRKVSAAGVLAVGEKPARKYRGKRRL